MPGLDNLIDVGWLHVERVPLAAEVRAEAGIVLEGEEGEVLERVVRLEVAKEAAEEGDAAIGVGPGVDIARCAFKRWAAEFGLRHQLVNGARELHVERGVILRQHALAIGLFAHFDPRDGVLLLVEVGNLVGRVLWRGVEHGDGHHGGQAASDATGEEEVKADLVAAVVDKVGGAVPGVYRRGPGDGLLAAGQVLHNVSECAVGADCAEVELVDGVADAVALVVGAVGVAGVGGVLHPDAQVADWRLPFGQLERGLAASALHDRAHGEGLP